MKTDKTISDKYIERIKNHPKLWVIFVISAIIAALSSILNFPILIAQLSKIITPPIYEKSEKMIFVDSDLEKYENYRFGYSILRPKNWDRQDPENGDGHTYISPKNSDIIVATWGSLRIDDEPYFDPMEITEDLGETQEKSIEDSDRKVIFNRYHGLNLYDWDNDDKTQVLKQKFGIPGWILKYQSRQNTTLKLVTAYGYTNFGVLCSVPTNKYSKYEDLCNSVVNSLKVLGKNSAPNARSIDCEKKIIGCELD